MSDRIEGVPEGYRLGNIITKVSEFEASDNAFIELIPIEPEQPKQLEAVIVVPITASGVSGRRISLDGFLSYGLDHYWANLLAVDHPDRVTIREKEASIEYDAEQKKITSLEADLAEAQRQLAASQQRERGTVERIHRCIVARMEDLDPDVSDFERGAFNNLKAQAKWIDETFLRALTEAAQASAEGKE